LEDYSLVYKYSGIKNTNMQIRATFDRTGTRILCGSEDQRVIIWKTFPEKARKWFGFGKPHNRNASFEFLVGNDGEQRSLQTILQDEASCGGACTGVRLSPWWMAFKGKLLRSHASSSSGAGDPRSPAAGSSAVLHGHGYGGQMMRHMSFGITDETDEDLEARAELQALQAPGHVATTVAIFAPMETLVAARPMSAFSQWSRGLGPLAPTGFHMQRKLFQSPAEAAAEEERRPANHFIIVAADSRGFIRVYENLNIRDLSGIAR
jgi:hypothetical protein